MRLWHKDMISVLPRQQLISQWRECCCIAKSIAEKGTPNHILVNKIMDYPLSQFWTYSCLIYNEMVKRHYKCNFDKFSQYFNISEIMGDKIGDTIFKDWHNERYFIQCYCNLEEKYDCGGISPEEWKLIEEHRCNNFYKPSKEGSWLSEYEPDGKLRCFHCSVCDDDFANIGITTKYPFCHNCGAKMIKIIPKKEEDYEKAFEQYYKLFR